MDSPPAGPVVIEFDMADSIINLSERYQHPVIVAALRETEAELIAKHNELIVQRQEEARAIQARYERET